MASAAPGQRSPIHLGEFMKFKPMLAETVELAEIRLPVFVSPKLDGVRAIVIDGKLMSRSLKPISNRALQGWVKSNAAALEGMDGELIAGDPTDPQCFNKTTSEVASADGRLETVAYYVFDLANLAQPFHVRYGRLQERVKGFADPRLQLVPHVRCESLADLTAMEDIAVQAGYEGMMTRAPNGPYKHGRSTQSEQWLLKLKRFEDSEGVIVDVIEQMAND